jgi:hypothetical protein
LDGSIVKTKEQNFQKTESDVHQNTSEEILEAHTLKEMPPSIDPV